MAFRQWHALAVSRSRSAGACQAFGVLVLLSLWAFERPAASLPPSNHRRFPSEASRIGRGTGNRRLPRPPPIERGVGNRPLPKPPSVERGVRRRQLPSPPPVRLSTPKRELPALDSIAAMIHGDFAPLQSTVDFLAELRQYGRVVERRFFAEPRRLENRKWKSALDSENIDFVPVPRGTDTSRDPTDDAIYRQVRELLQSRRIGAIALLVADKDYVPLVEEIVGTGRRCFVKTKRNGPGRMEPFERAGAQILAHDPMNALKYTGVLHSNGSGSFRKISDASVLSVESPGLDEQNRMTAQLCELGYRSSTRDPLIPSIAKFWFDNGLGDLIVFPGNYALTSMSEICRQRHSAKWVSGRRDLAFIFPRCLTKSKKAVQECGSQACASYVKAGVGPFILRDSPTLVQEMMRKIGYIDDDLNACFQEGLEVFASMSGNARAMRQSGIQLSDLGTTSEKEEQIRRLCLSDSFTGQFQTPPWDAEVRTYLFANGLLKNQGAPADEVFFAMESSLRSACLVPKKTYNGRVLQCLDIYTGRKRDPNRRQ